MTSPTAVEPVLDRDRLAAAKLWLVSGRPAASGDGPRGLAYLSEALYALVAVPCREVDTLQCDRHWRLYVNPLWLSVATVPQVAAALVHAVWHLLHEHAERAHDLGVRPATARDWHLAADAALHATLRESRAVPDDVPDPRLLGLPPGLTAEEYFALLSKLPADTAADEERSDAPEPACGSACDGLVRPHELPPDADPFGTEPDDARHLRRAVAIAYREHVTTYGSQPGDAWRWATQILEPKVRWEPLLAGAVRRAVAWTNGRTEFTYTRRSRRQSAVPQVLLPGTRRGVPVVAVVIDTSGSVDDLLLARALGEVDGALRGLGVADARVTALAVDVEVHVLGSVRSARGLRLAGGGGTDLRPGIAAAAELRPRPDIVIVLTDGYTPWPEHPPPGAAVIVALLHRSGDSLPPTPAWATRIACAI